jgi:hypothetical protein
MKIKKMFAAMAAAAVSTASMAVFTIAPTASAADVVATAEVVGQFGTYQYWGADSPKNDGEVSGTSASIDGNAQYETTINLSGDGTASIEFLILQIKGLGTTEDNVDYTSDQYPDLSVTINDIVIDGESVPFDSNDGAYRLNWYEGTGHVRVFLTDTWGINDGGDLGLEAPDDGVTTYIKVKFTVNGMYDEGTSNLTPDAVVDKSSGEAEEAGSDDTSSSESGSESATKGSDSSSNGSTSNSSSGSNTESTKANDSSSKSENSTKSDGDAETSGAETTTAASNESGSSDNSGNSSNSNNSGSSSKSSNSSSSSSSKASSNGGSDETSADTGDAGTGIAVAALALAGAAAIVSRKRK